MFDHVTEFRLGYQNISMPNIEIDAAVNEQINKHMEIRSIL